MESIVESNKQEIVVEGNSHVKVVRLNRPQKFNALTHQMEVQLLKMFRQFENDPDVKLVVLKGTGRVFSAGADVISFFHYALDDHWSMGMHAYKKYLQLEYMVATFKKCQVSLINGSVMGAGAALTVVGRFRVVTENTSFAMPEAIIGHFPDIGASYFLSRLPGFFGEYIGLTGAKLDGADMHACGLATHYVASKNLPLLEEELHMVDTDDHEVINAIINRYTLRAPLKKNSAYGRLDLINKCFSKGSVEEILVSLEHELVNGKDGWIAASIKSINMGSPTLLKLFLRSIRKGRHEDIRDCLIREYRMATHLLRKTVTGDFFEGVRAKLLDKDNTPKWKPSKLELVTEEMVDTYFTKLDEDEGWEELQLPRRSSPHSLGSTDVPKGLSCPCYDRVGHVSNMTQTLQDTLGHANVDVVSMSSCPYHVVRPFNTASNSTRAKL